MLVLPEPGPRLRPAASLLPRLVTPSWRLLGRLWRLLRRTGPRLRDPRLEELRLEEPGPRQLLAASLLLRLAALSWRVLGRLLRLLPLLRLLEPRLQKLRLLELWLQQGELQEPGPRLRLAAFLLLRPAGRLSKRMRRTAQRL